jgi:hypothetical protein
LVVSLNGLENILRFDLHGSGKCHLTNDWEWLLVRRTHATTEAVGLAVVTCTER